MVRLRWFKQSDVSYDLRISLFQISSSLSTKTMTFRLHCNRMATKKYESESNLIDKTKNAEVVEVPSGKMHDRSGIISMRFIARYSRLRFKFVSIFIRCSDLVSKNKESISHIWVLSAQMQKLKLEQKSTIESRLCWLCRAEAILPRIRRVS